MEMTCMYVMVSGPLSFTFELDVHDGTNAALDRQCHREQLSIEHSMRDLDSAVGRLDNIFMSLYVFVVFLIIAVALVSSVF
jgi:hypothetical protein